MRLFKGFILAIGLLAGVYSCSPLKKIEGSKMAALATYASQNYSQAYTQLTTVINNYKSANMKVPYDIFVKAADCASRLKNFDGALDYYSQALSDSVSVVGVKGYISSLQNLGSATKVTEALSKYSSFLNKEGESDYLLDNQMKGAIEVSDNKAIIELFPKLKSSDEEQSIAYITALESEGQKKEAVSFCSNLIKENPSYNKAKEWKAVYYYNIAEEGYKKEMAKYNKNKTYTAYVYLKRDLKKVSGNYRVAKGLFEDLRKEYSTENKYIKYLKNIYVRLELKREAAAMEKLLK